MDDGIVIEKIIDAPRKAVWKAWTDPEMIKKWWGPKDFTAPVAKVDLRVGGKYIFCMHGSAGSEWDKDMYSAGVYKEIVTGEKIATTDYFSDENGNKMDPVDFGQDKDAPDEMNVIITFEEAGEGQTKLTIRYPRPESEEQFQAMLKSGMKEGWTQSLEKLEESLK